MKPAPDFDICFHCGLPLTADAQWKVSIGGLSRRMCCPGCQAVAEAIVSSGCADYYVDRSNYSISANDRDVTTAAQS